MTRMLRRCGASVILIVCLAGCGSAVLAPGRIRSALMLAPPAGPLAGRGVQAALALSPRRFVVTTTRATRGDAYPVPGGEIELTTDGGRHWRVVLSERGISFSGLVRAGRRLIATGAAIQTSGRSVAGIGPTRLWVSADRGVHWRELRPRGTGAAALRGDTLWPSPDGRTLLAVPDGDQYSAQADGFTEYPDAGVLRSTDGGRTWRAVRLPPFGTAFGDASWVGDDSVYVTGYAQRGCAGPWHSRNGGRTFARTAWACPGGRAGTPHDGDLDFLSARIGYSVGGGLPGIVEPGESVDETTDGGARWHRIWSTDSGAGGPFPLDEVDFVNRRDGWAVPGGHYPAAEQPYLGDLLVTHDGGHHWADTGIEADGFSALAGGRTALAVLGVADPTQNLALTRDGGISWTELTERWVRYDGLLGGGGWVIDETSAGDFLSTDGGRRWLSLPQPQPYAYPTALSRGRLLDEGFGAASDHCSTLTSTDAGRHWRRFIQPGIDPDSVCFSDALTLSEAGRADAVPDPVLCTTGEARPSAAPTYASADGGGEWHRTGRLPGMGADVDAMTATGRVVLFTASTTPDTIACHRVAVSTDGGRHWKIVAAARTCGGASGLDGRLWLGCGDWLEISDDAGRRWTSRRIPRAVNLSSIVATGRSSAIATSRGSDLVLWRTTDLGHTWNRYEPALPIGLDHAPIRSYRNPWL